MPVYNVEKYLKRAFDSIYNQTFQDYELIVVNDGSTDSSEQICLDNIKDRKNVQYYKKENGGLVSAWMYGLKYAKGEYICFIDSDDFIADNYLETLGNNVGDCDLVSMNCVRYWNDTKSSNYKTNMLDDGEYEINDDLKQRVICNFGDYRKLIANSRWGKLIKRDLVMKCTKYVSEDISFGEDQQLIVPIILSSKKVRILDQYLYFYQYNEESIVNTYKKDMWLKIKKLIGILENIDLVKEIPNYQEQLATMTYLYTTECLKNALKIKDNKQEILDVIKDPFLINSLDKVYKDNIQRLDKMLYKPIKKGSVSGIKRVFFIYKTYCKVFHKSF